MRTSLKITRIVLSIKLKSRWSKLWELTSSLPSISTSPLFHSIHFYSIPLLSSTISQWNFPIQSNPHLYWPFNLHSIRSFFHFISLHAWLLLMSISIPTVSRESKVHHLTLNSQYLKKPFSHRSSSLPFHSRCWYLQWLCIWNSLARYMESRDRSATTSSVLGS